MRSQIRRSISVFSLRQNGSLFPHMENQMNEELKRLHGCLLVIIARISAVEQSLGELWEMLHEIQDQLDFERGEA